MAPICNTSLRVHAFGKIDTMLALTPDEIRRLIEAPQSEERQEIQDDPCLSYLMDQYVEAERSRFQNSNAGPTLQALRLKHVYMLKKSLINVESFPPSKGSKEFGSDKMFGDEGIAGIVEKLEKEKRAIMERPNLAIEDNTKSLMKYMKHVSWKKRKLNEDTK